jgi:cytochrome c55X
MFGSKRKRRDEARSRPRNNGALALAAALAASAFVPAVAGEGGPSPARASELAYLVRQDCGSCHGMTLKGGLGAPLLPETLAGKHEDALAAVILDGMPGTPMPPWRPLLTEAEAVWIARALKEGLP